MKYDREEKVVRDVRRDWRVQKEAEKQDAERLSQMPQFTPHYGQFYKSLQLCQLCIVSYYLLTWLEVLLTRTTFFDRQMLLVLLPTVFNLFSLSQSLCICRQKRIWEASQRDENKDAEKNAVMVEKC